MNRYLVEMSIPVTKTLTVYLRYPHDGFTGDEADRVCGIVQSLVTKRYVDTSNWDGTFNNETPKEAADD